MKKDDTVYLKHILDAINQIVDYVRPIAYEGFVRNRMLQDAVVRQLEIIGEASRNVSADFQAQHSEIPWTQMIGMRNRIAHDYLNVDMEIVWDIVEHDLTSLEEQIKKILAS
ncbi:MAG: DUF86 domain-containing protein [candidate division WOR-3 bacterium]